MSDRLPDPDVTAQAQPETEPADAKHAPARSLRSNILMGSYARLSTIVAALVVSPVVVAHLGLRTYGFWALLQGLVLYVQIADGGFPAAGTAMVGRAKTRTEVQSIMAVVATTLIPIAVAVVALAGVIATVLPAGLSSGFPGGWRAAVVGVGVAVAFTMVSSGFSAGVAGVERWDLQAAGQLLSQVVTATMTIGLMLLGGGIEELAFSIACGAIASALYFGVQAYRLGSIRFRRGVLRRRVFGELLRQGASMQIIAIVEITTAQADRYMLLPFASLQWIGAYDLGSRVAVTLKTLPTTSLGPILTRIATLFGTEGMAAVKQFYPRLFRDCIRLAVVPLIAAYGVAFPAVQAWLGPSFTTSAGVATILGVGYALNFATGAGTSAARAAGRADIERDYTVVALVLNVACTAAFGVIWGAWGVVAATSLSMLIGSLWLLRSVDRWLEIDVASLRTAMDVTTARAIAIATAVLGGTIATSLLAANAGAGRWGQLVLAAVAGIVAVGAVGGRPALRAARSRLSPRAS